MERGKKLTVGVVCLGNVYRSRGSEGVVKSLVGNYIDIFSAGLKPFNDMEGIGVLKMVMESRGYTNIPVQHPQVLNQEMIDRADMLWMADEELLKESKTIFPGAKDKITQLSHFAQRPDIVLTDPKPSIPGIAAGSEGVSLIYEASLPKWSFLFRRRNPSKEVHVRSHQEADRIRANILLPFFDQIEEVSALAVVRLVEEGFVSAKVINRASPAYQRYQLGQMI